MGLALLHEDLTEAQTDSIDADSIVSPETTPSQDPEVTSRKKVILRNWTRSLEEIQATAASSVDVLNDLLNYDKIEMGSLSLELSVFSIWHLVAATTMEFQLSAKKKSIHFVSDWSALMQESAHNGEQSFAAAHIVPQLQSSMLVGDRTRILQVLRNLLSNAIKFTPEGGTVTVKASWIAPPIQTRTCHQETFTLHSEEEVSFDPAGSACIEVIDTGAGMTKDQLARLGREGVQFNVNELQAGQGSGLGLFISKGIVLQHGGHLKVSSAGTGMGSTFACVLPLHYVPSGSFYSEGKTQETPLDRGTKLNDNKKTVHQQKRGSDVETCSLRVLVVDDVVTNRKLLKRLVTKRGHWVEVARDGREAVDLVSDFVGRGTPFDVILMDYEMPILRGPEAVKEMRGLGVNAFIVGITGNVLSEDIQYFVSCGANCVLPKPVEMHRLEELLSEHGVFESAMANQLVSNGSFEKDIDI